MKKGLLVSLSIATALSTASIATGVVTNTFWSPSVVQAAALGSVYVFDTKADVYNAPNGTITRSLPMGSGWQYFETQKDGSGTTWYRVGTSEWINDKQAVTSIQPGSVKAETGTVVVASTATVWTTPNLHKESPARTLPTGSNWKYFRTFKDSWGLTWYNVGGTEWVNSGEVTPSTQTDTGWYYPLTKGRGQFSAAQKFGWGRGSFHDGLDFGSYDFGSDRQIRAVHAGTVKFVGNPGIPELGNAIIVIHTYDGYDTIYQEFGVNMNDISVRVGQKVNAKQVIGYFDVGGWNGVATIDHLHFGVTKSDWRAAQSHAFSDDGTWIDPLSFLW
ncbi:MAG: M23 family metallopeptidase [Schleiferilactobacillus perolens]|uniref:M23 family metallopeptidase n=1 Tax=Schleiferilactobacillus perolens TaxID=100468 RepID=UPI0039EC3232